MSPLSPHSKTPRSERSGQGQDSREALFGQRAEEDA